MNDTIRNEIKNIELSRIRCFVFLTRSQQRFEALVEAILGNNIHMGIVYSSIKAPFLCV